MDNNQEEKYVRGQFLPYKIIYHDKTFNFIEYMIKKNEDEKKTLTKKKKKYN